MASKKVYVLRSEHDAARHYVGITADVIASVRGHNAGESPHTRKHTPWRLVVAMQFAEEELALRFERYLKSGAGRAFARQHFG